MIQYVFTYIELQQRAAFHPYKSLQALPRKKTENQNLENFQAMSSKVETKQTKALKIKDQGTQMQQNCFST